MLAPDKAKSRYPNWEILTKREKEAVRNQLMDENHDVRRAYTNLLCHLYYHLNLTKLIQTIFNCLHIALVMLKVASNFLLYSILTRIVMLVLFLVSCANTAHAWFNYEIHQVIIENLGTIFLILIHSSKV